MLAVDIWVTVPCRVVIANQFIVNVCTAANRHSDLTDMEAESSHQSPSLSTAGHLVSTSPVDVTAATDQLSSGELPTTRLFA